MYRRQGGGPEAAARGGRQRTARALYLWLLYTSSFPIVGSTETKFLCILEIFESLELVSADLIPLRLAVSVPLSAVANPETRLISLSPKLKAKQLMIIMSLFAESNY
jgi:hypothetical protein